MKLTEKNILGKHILAIFAHPDDEAFTIAGTAYKNKQNKGKTTLICATLGEQGNLHLKKPLTKNELKRVRKKELEKATKIMKIDRLHILNLPDSKLKDNKTKFYNKALKIINKNDMPDLIISFDKYGITGHKDHISSHIVSKKISKKLKLPLYSVAVSPKRAKNFAKKIKQRKRHESFYKKQIKHPKPDIKIKINRDIKRKALNSYKSQGVKVFFKKMSRQNIKEIMNYEYFKKDR